MTEEELYNEYRNSDCKTFTDFLINKIAELEKENAELKKLKRECETSLCRAEYQYNYEQLTEAKEIIREYLSLFDKLHNTIIFNIDEDLKQKAKAFLKE